MSEATDQPGDDLSDDIVGITDYEMPIPPRRDFLPWHAPRKQYVRDKQWAREIGQLLDEIQPAEHALKYLGLPGTDLLDLRHIHGTLCVPRGLDLRFLGFNTAALPTSPAQVELNISLDEVKRLSGVDPRSDVISDDFTRLAFDSSIAWNRAFALGPYDVINLDLCGSIAGTSPHLDQTYYKAINRLLSLQARSKTPWLLLVTTRIGPDHVHKEVLSALLEKYAENLANCQPFAAASTSLFQVADRAAAETAMVQADKRGVCLLLSAIAKWLLSIALRQQPPTTVELRSVLGYRVTPSVGHEDLASLALKFSPTFLYGGDPIGLAPGAQQPDECDLATRALPRVAYMRDVDKTLAEDQTLLAQLIDASATLLASARYDETAYRAWVAERGAA
jgi:hypothetical protein